MIPGPGPCLAALGLCLLAAAAAAAKLPDRSHIFVVGSSTAYPIVTAAAEYIGRRDGITTPVVESTGTGGGLKHFCSGYGLDTPDIAMASRRMRESERNDCIANQVNDVREIRIGHDGIVIAGAKQAARFDITRRQLYLAIAREVPAPDGSGRLQTNPYRSWQQIDQDLPDMPIRLLGPPPTSGTRDILVERVMRPACLGIAPLRALHQSDSVEFANHCYAIREDGAFVDSGENDARVVRKLLTDPGALGVLGYNFLDRNRDRLQAATIDGIAPSFEAIESGVYPLSRPLFLYVKPRHSRLIPSLDRFVAALVSAAVSGPEGYLVDRGLIPLTASERAAGR